MSITNEYVGAVGLRLFIRNLGKVDKRLAAELRPRLRAVGREVVREASVNASWSTRIPRAMSVRVALGQKNPGVFIRVNAARAPHARPFEGLTTRGSTFRHPVFGIGDRRGFWTEDRWVAQEIRPFLFPAVRGAADRVQAEVAEAIGAAVQEAGFH